MVCLAVVETGVCGEERGIGSVVRRVQKDDASAGITSAMESEIQLPNEAMAIPGKLTLKNRPHLHIWKKLKFGLERYFRRI